MRKQLLVWMLLLCLLLSGCPLEAAPGETTAEPIETQSVQTLEVHFLDVGQADCAVIQCGDEFAVIDGGYYENGQMVADYLKAQGATELALVVGTHPHGDHIGGLPVVMRNFPVKEVWSSVLPFSNGNVSLFEDAARKQGLQLYMPKPGETMQLGGATITVLGPIRTDYEDVNDLSLVVMVEFGSTRFLFTGDMERIGETDLLDSGADVKADVLKVGHHGSYSSTGYRLLREVNPTWAVISVGVDNEYGHPHSGPMSRLRDAQVIVHRTDLQSTIVAVSDGENIVFGWHNVNAQPGIPTLDKDWW